jgi:hypothetical protein
MVAARVLGCHDTMATAIAAAPKIVLMIGPIGPRPKTAIGEQVAHATLAGLSKAKEPIQSPPTHRIAAGPRAYGLAARRPSNFVPVE